MMKLRTEIVVIRGGFLLPFLIMFYFTKGNYAYSQQYGSENYSKCYHWELVNDTSFYCQFGYGRGYEQLNFQRDSLVIRISFDVNSNTYYDTPDTFLIRDNKWWMLYANTTYLMGANGPSHFTLKRKLSEEYVGKPHFNIPKEARLDSFWTRYENRFDTYSLIHYNDSVFTYQRIIQEPRDISGVIREDDHGVISDTFMVSQDEYIDTLLFNTKVGWFERRYESREDGDYIILKKKQIDCSCLLKSSEYRENARLMQQMYEDNLKKKKKRVSKLLRHFQKNKP